MKKTALIFISIFFVAGCFVKTAQTSIDNSDPNVAFLKYVETQDSILDLLLPQRSAERGEFIISQMNKWNDASSEGEKKIFDYHRRRLQDLNVLNTSKLDEFTLTQYKILRFESELVIESEKFQNISNAFAANHFYSIPSDLEGWIHGKHRVSNEQEAIAYINRLKSVPTLLQQIIKKVESAQQSGVISPKSEVEKSISRYKEMAQSMVNHNSTTDEDIDVKFKQFPTLKSAAKQVLVDSVANAYKNLSEFLEKKILKHTKPEIGLWQYPNGLAYYTHLLKVQTSLDITSDEVLEIGKQAVAHYQKQIIDLKSKSTKNKDLDLAQYFEMYRSNGSVSSQDFKQQMEVKAREMEPHWKKLFDIEVPPVSIVFDPFEGRAREELDFTVNPPKPVFYLNPNATPDDYLYYNWDMLELLAHEGIPGHGLEQYYTALLKLPKFRKNFSFNSYAEGWALYAEYLPKEVGFYQDENEEFGRLASSLFRACRLVVDAGIHSGKMKNEEAMNFLLENSPYPKGMLKSQVLRYTAMPAQACCYYLGANLIWNLRKYSEATLGNNFNIKEFHSTILKDGNLPLTLLKEKVIRWAKTKRNDTKTVIVEDIFQLSNISQGQAFLTTEDEFTKMLTEFDMAARMKSLKPVTKKEYLDFVKGSIMEFTTEEKALLKGIIKSTCDKLPQFDIKVPSSILLIKTSGQEEGHAAYTRGNAIIIPENYFKTKSKEQLEETFVHELWHIVSRANPSLKERIYEKFGFTKCNFEVPDSLKTRLVTNPDAVDYHYCFKSKIAGTTVLVAPILYSVGQYDDASRKKEFFVYITSIDQAIKKGYVAKRVPTLFEVENSHRCLNAWQTENFNPDTFGTDYLFHPEEIAAEHFVKLYSIDFSHPYTVEFTKTLFNN